MCVIWCFMVFVICRFNRMWVHVRVFGVWPFAVDSLHSNHLLFCTNKRFPYQIFLGGWIWQLVFTVKCKPYQMRVFLLCEVSLVALECTLWHTFNDACANFECIMCVCLLAFETALSTWVWVLFSVLNQCVEYRVTFCSFCFVYIFISCVTQCQKTLIFGLEAKTVKQECFLAQWMADKALLW